MLAFSPPLSGRDALLRLMIGAAYATQQRPGRVSLVPIRAHRCETCGENFAIADHTATAREDSGLTTVPPLGFCPPCFAALMPDRLEEYRERRPLILFRASTLAG